MEQLGQDDPQSFKRLIWAMALMGVVFVGMSYFMRSKGDPTPLKGGQAVESATNAAASEATPPTSGAGQTLQDVPSVGSLQAVQGEKENSFTLENDDLRLEFTSRGAVITKAVLKKYREKGGPNDDLVSPLAQAVGIYPLSLSTGDKEYDEAVAGALFHVEQISDASGAKGLKMSWADGQGSAVNKTFMLPSSGYELGLQVAALKGNKPLSPVPLSWGPGLGHLLQSQVKDRYFKQEYVGLSQAGAYKKVDRSKVKPGSPPVREAWGDKGPLDWAALTNNYFAAIFLPIAPMPSATIVTRALTTDEQKLHPAETAVELVVAFPERGKVFIGPKEWQRWSSMGGNLFKLQDWGWLSPICAFLLWSLNKIYALVANYGVAILLLTLVIKVAFYPLTQRSMVKMKEMGEGMKKLKPQVDRIKAKYKKMGKDMTTRSKMNEEMMALYQREGINPLGGMTGCLPLLLQMPIFFALFTLLPLTIELRGAPFFGWIQDLSVQDPYYVTPILMGLSMFISTKMTATTGMEGSQKMILYFMPVMFTWICLWAPAGLTLYWLANNILTMGQQALINRQVAQRQEAAAKGRKSTPKGPSRPS
jgi:YidC/Oxa1 family membrane protein insertase